MSPFISVRFQVRVRMRRVILDDHWGWPGFQDALGGGGGGGKGLGWLRWQASKLPCLRDVCRECDGGPVEFREDLYRREGLVTHPYLFCVACTGKSPIWYAKVGTTRRLALNESSVLALLWTIHGWNTIP